VTLIGSVEDHSAASDAVENAREAGAKKVINKLTIESTTKERARNCLKSGQVARRSIV
jgi:ribonuclease BN (tRNA processing enzyme)